MQVTTNSVACRVALSCASKIAYPLTRRQRPTDPPPHSRMAGRPAACGCALSRGVHEFAADFAHNVDRIIATLGLKEMSQSMLIRKLCALSQQNPTRKAVFEFDKLVRSIYTFDYIRDPQLQRDVHRSQNRIEAYHQLRSAISQVGGKKQLIGTSTSHFSGRATTQRSGSIREGW
jgi:hypothetical protein